MTGTELLLELSRRYCQPHRRYHDLRHIANMLVRGGELGLTDDQVMAIWFHDAVYDPLSRTNEVDSAALAADLLMRAGWEVPRIHVVERMVLDTAGHMPSIPESAEVIDLDLCTLAGTWKEYAANSALIRAEYSAVSTEEFDAGRAEWLRGMLARPRIFWTEWGAPLEEKAQANLARDLNELD